MSDNTTNDSTSSDSPAGNSAAQAKPVRRRAAARPAGPPQPVVAPGGDAAAPSDKPAGKSAAKPAAKSAKSAKSAVKPADKATVKPAETSVAPTRDARKSGDKKSQASGDSTPASSAKSNAEDADKPATKSSGRSSGRSTGTAAKKAAASASQQDSTATSGDASGAPAAAFLAPVFQAPEASAAPKTRAQRPPRGAAAAGAEVSTDVPAGSDDSESSDSGAGTANRRRRGSRGRRGKGGSGNSSVNQNDEDSAQESQDEGPANNDEAADGNESGEGSAHRRRRRRRAGDGEGADGQDTSDGSTVVHVRTTRPKDDLRGSTRVESRKNRRRDGRENNRRRVNISESEFLARRESVDRVMVVRDREGITQIGVLEDGILVEHYVTQAGSTSFIGNVYLGRVQNVLPSMEAVFIDIGRGRNGVLYAGEINWDLLGITKTEDRRVENALKAGDSILVQVSKDPVGQKGARLTHMASLPGRYVVYVPNSTTTGISRKLADNERNRLKSILRGVLPEDGGVIVRTAAEGASEEELSRDVHRLLAQWEDIKAKSTTAKAPALLYSEPDMTIKVVRDIFNEDFKVLKVAGDDSHDTVRQYIEWVAPDLLPRLEKWIEPQDIFTAHRVDEQLAKALDRKVHLPSGGSLVIDRTEAMTVVDVNTGRFIGSGGNLEETVTKNNLEAAEEIVRQLRLRDIGGIIVVDFIDMVLETNRDLVLRRLVECLGRDRTKHQVAEVTSLGLVQMTRKRIGQGLLEVFSAPCDHCNGRGVRITAVPVPVKEDRADADRRPRAGSGSEGRSDGRSDSRSESKPEARADDSGEGRSSDRTKHQVKSGSARNQGRSGRGKQVGATSSASPSTNASSSTASHDVDTSVPASGASSGSGGSAGESTSPGGAGNLGDTGNESAATAVSLSAE